jgi:inorganic pyrophosphatase
VRRSDRTSSSGSSSPIHGTACRSAPSRRRSSRSTSRSFPSDTVKYELDKDTGLLKIDRPQRFSNVCPTLYGFIPQTHCGSHNAELTARRTGRAGIVGDGDPLDICVLTEKMIPRGDIVLQARPIGGLRMIDRGEADDKVIAILEGDASYGAWRDVHQVPKSLIDRLRHYFLTYKAGPDALDLAVEITHIYDREEAHDVIRRSQLDYRSLFPDRAKPIRGLSRTDPTRRRGASRTP